MRSMVVRVRWRGPAMHAHVVALTLEPVDRLDLDEREPVALAHDEAVRRRRGRADRGAAAWCASSPSRRSASDAPRCKRQPRRRALERLAHPRRIDRLEHVVDARAPRTPYGVPARTP